MTNEKSTNVCQTMYCKWWAESQVLKECVNIWIYVKYMNKSQALRRIVFFIKSQKKKKNSISKIQSNHIVLYIAFVAKPRKDFG